MSSQSRNDDQAAAVPSEPESAPDVARSAFDRGVLWCGRGAAWLIRAMDAIRFFAIIFITTNGGPADSTKIIPIRLYDIAFRFFDLGYAAAVGITMLVFSIMVATAFTKLLKRQEKAS